MISLEQYASVYLAMVSAMANPQQQDALCEGRGFSAADWRSAQTFYTAKRPTPAYIVRSAIALGKLLSRLVRDPGLVYIRQDLVARRNF